jgi:hypothetical protein
MFMKEEGCVWSEWVVVVLVLQRAGGDFVCRCLLC